MQRLLGNNTDNDTSSNEYNCMNVDSDSGTDIGYETDMTEDNANMDVIEDSGGDEDHDISDFAELFADNEHSLEYLTRFSSDQVALLPQVIDNVYDNDGPSGSGFHLYPYYLSPTYEVSYDSSPP